MTGIVPFAAFLWRFIGKGSLLVRRCFFEDVDVNVCSERKLSQLDVRPIVDIVEVYIVVGIDISDCFLADSSNYLLNFKKMRN